MGHTVYNYSVFINVGGRGGFFIRDIAIEDF